MKEFKASIVMDELNTVIDILLNNNVNAVTLNTLDRIGLITHIIVNRLNVNDYEFNRPEIISITEIEPQFNIIVSKVKVDGKSILLGTEQLNM